MGRKGATLPIGDERYQHGEISSALTKLERVLDLNRRSPDSTIPERDAQYQSLYNQIRTEREAARPDAEPDSAACRQLSLQ